MSNPPTPSEEFEELTGLMPYVIAETVASKPEDRERVALTVGELRWFCQHVDYRFRYMHANNPAIKKSLSCRSYDERRDRAYNWVEHWFVAYAKDRELYMERHSQVSDKEAACES